MPLPLTDWDVLPPLQRFRLDLAQPFRNGRTVGTSNGWKHMS